MLIETAPAAETSAPQEKSARAVPTIAYLINQYPQSSHSFIRREIAALEKQGIRVERFTIRRWRTPLVDPADCEEQSRTRAILDAGSASLLLALLATLFSHPIRFCRALGLAIRVGHRSDRGLGRNLAYFVEACLLRRWLIDEKIAHIHAHFGTNSTSVAMLAHVLGGVTYSFTAHGPEEFDKPQSLGLTEKLRRAQFVIAISDFCKSQLYRWCDESHWPKIQVVRCGVDDEFLSVTPTPVPDVKKLVCVGRLCEQKGQLLLIQAAAQLAAEGVDFSLTLVGDGPMRKSIQALIDRCKLGSRVTIAGWMSGAQVRQQILDSRALVLPSFAEGLPVVIMEALALHRPVVTTYIAGIPELVRSGDSGWLVPPGDIEGLTRGMREVLQAPVERLSQMGAVGAQAVARLHSSASEAEKLARLFAGSGG